MFTETSELFALTSEQYQIKRWVHCDSFALRCNGFFSEKKEDDTPKPRACRRRKYLDELIPDVASPHKRREALQRIYEKPRNSEMLSLQLFYFLFATFVLSDMALFFKQGFRIPRPIARKGAAQQKEKGCNKNTCCTNHDFAAWCWCWCWGASNIFYGCWGANNADYFVVHSGDSSWASF